VEEERSGSEFKIKGLNSVILKSLVRLKSVGDFKNNFSSIGSDDSGVDGGLANSRVNVVNHESDDVSGLLFASSGTDEFELFSSGALEVVTCLEAVVVSVDVVLGQTDGVGFFLFAGLVVSGAGKGVRELG